jgi:hypothetical protein
MASAVVCVLAALAASVLSTNSHLVSAGFGVVAGLAFVSLLLTSAVAVFSIVAFPAARNRRHVLGAVSGVGLLAAFVLLVLSSGI